MTMEPKDPTGSALVFPGMAPTRFTDVAKFMLINPHARGLLKSADEVLGYSLFDRYRAADGDYTEYAQVAFFLNCVALAQWAEQEYGMRPAAAAGPSFGSKAAAVFSGVLEFADAVRMTARMARVENDYFTREFQDAVTFSFTRTPWEKLEEVLAELDERGEWHDLSCHIDDDFYMVSLDGSNVEWMEKRLRSMGGMPLYTMRPPMHCGVFGPLRDRIAQEVLAELEFADPVLPVVADQDGSLLTTGEQVRQMILDGYVLPVRWPDVVATLRERLGVEQLYVCGPDSLFGRVRITTRSFADVVPVKPRTAMLPRRATAAA
ncbi:ACP S-malonyltransferase [Streptomyces sp. NPDC004542]|uniref:ACP S-malonyltransferase n=1 Tax=Streptomyces sp. NPDC004542 TaxID=3154281 RepID=UPI0033B9A031